MTPTMTPIMTPIMTPTMTPNATKIMKNRIACPPQSTSTSNSQLDKSVFYVSDCLGYPIKDVLFKNNTLILELDTNDDSMLYSGYYKLVL